MKLDSPPLFSTRQKHFNKRDKMGVYVSFRTKKYFLW
jgi:hypothetical protein